MLGKSFDAALSSASDGSREDIVVAGASDGDCELEGEGGDVVGWDGG